MKSVQIVVWSLLLPLASESFLLAFPQQAKQQLDSFKIQRRTNSVASRLYSFDGSIQTNSSAGEDSSVDQPQFLLPLSSPSSPSSQPSSPDSSKKRELRSPPIFAFFMSAISSTGRGAIPRTESHAYPRQTNMISKLQLFLRQHTRLVGVVIAAVTFVVVLGSDFFYDQIPVRASGLRGGSVLSKTSDSNPYAFSGAAHLGHFRIEDSIIYEDDHVAGFHFSMVTDQDELSSFKDKKGKTKYRSHMVNGQLLKTKGDSQYLYKIEFDNSPVRDLITGHNEAGRGAEFSELTIFDHRLLTFDDRTGDVFEIINNGDGTSSSVVPRLVITEGDGDTDKGMKWEWATVKDNELYMGSMGKEFTNKQGEIENVNNLWIAVANRAGEYRRENWEGVYDTVRGALGARRPGYVIMEAVNWSETMKKWVFLPRRISSEAYNDVLDEKRGGRKLVFLDENFHNPKVVEMQLESADPLRGFSSFTFVPNTQDKHILALRSIEEDCALDDDSLCKQSSYAVALDITTGKQLSPEVKYKENWKFEGIEFLNPYVVPSSS